MFTGLVETLGTIQAITRQGPAARLVVAEPTIAPEATIGESIAVNGVCLTVVERDAKTFAFEAGPETLARTNLGELAAGDRVNLERALRLTDRLGGHIVQGHVDGVGAITRREPEADWETLWFSLPAELGRFLVPKGSITVDGVSLTVVAAEKEAFSVALIPHTLSGTTLGFKKPGARVNLETDLIAKHLVRYLDGLDWTRVRPNTGPDTSI